MSSAPCPSCGHVSPPDARFCSSCGASLLVRSDQTTTISITKVDPLQDAIGTEDDITVSLAHLPPGTGVLVVRSSPQAGETFVLGDATRLGRHPDSEISLDDITVSRRHAAIERRGDDFVVSDAGSLNGTYVNQQRIDAPVTLRTGDEVQVGKFRLVFVVVAPTP